MKNLKLVKYLLWGEYTFSKLYGKLCFVQYIVYVFLWVWCMFSFSYMYDPVQTCHTHSILMVMEN